MIEDEDGDVYDSDEAFPSPTPSEVDEAMRNGTLPNPMRMLDEQDRDRDGWDVVFDTALYVIPFTSLFVMLDM